MLLFSIASGFLWSIATFYLPEMPRRVANYEGTNYEGTVHSFGVYVDPIAYVIAGALTAVGSLLVIAASRLR